MVPIFEATLYERIKIEMFSARLQMCEFDTRVKDR